MALEQDFQAAQSRVKALPKTPAADQLLELYGLYKQATLGDVTGERPGRLDFRGRAKFDAWSRRRGMSTDDAMTAYVAVVERLEAALGA